MIGEMRIWRRQGARIVQESNLIIGEMPTDRSEVLPELHFVSRSHDNGRHRGPACKPVERHLRNCFVELSCDIFKGINDAVEMLLIDRRTKASLRFREDDCFPALERRA